jgi:hypothetical protein
MIEKETGNIWGECNQELVHGIEYRGVYDTVKVLKGMINS